MAPNQSQSRAFVTKPRNLTAGLLLASAALCLVGCASPQPEPTPNPLRLNVAPGPLWWVCLDELKARGFELDQANQQRGLVVTKPMTSSQFFESWRRDLVSPSDSLEASLHTIRRRVSLSLEPADTGYTRLTCQTSVERLSRPLQLVAGRVRLGDLFGKTAGRMPRLAPQERPQDAPVQWVALGRDEALEKDILRSVSTTVHTRPVESEFLPPWKRCPTSENDHVAQK